MKDLVAIVARTTTQSDLAARAGCTQGHLSMVLRKEKGCTIDLAMRISEALGGEICALHIRYPDGIPHGLGGERACRCQGAASPDTTAHESQCPQDGPNAPGTDADTTADGGAGPQVQREGVTHDEDDTATPAAGDRRAA